MIINTRAFLYLLSIIFILFLRPILLKRGMADRVLPVLPNKVDELIKFETSAIVHYGTPYQNDFHNEAPENKVGLFQNSIMEMKIFCVSAYELRKQDVA